MRTIQFAAIHHLPWLEYRHALPDGRVCIRLKTAKGDFTRVTLRAVSTYSFPHYFAGADSYPMTVAFRDQFHDVYECIFKPKDVRFKYLFVLESDELTFKLDGAGLHAGRDAE